MHGQSLTLKGAAGLIFTPARIFYQRCLVKLLRSALLEVRTNNLCRVLCPKERKQEVRREAQSWFGADNLSGHISVHLQRKLLTDDRRHLLMMRAVGGTRSEKSLSRQAPKAPDKSGCRAIKVRLAQLRPENEVDGRFVAGLLFFHAHGNVADESSAP